MRYQTKLETCSTVCNSVTSNTIVTRVPPFVLGTHGCLPDSNEQLEDITFAEVTYAVKNRIELHVGLRNSESIYQGTVEQFPPQAAVPFRNYPNGG